MEEGRALLAMTRNTPGTIITTIIPAPMIIPWMKVPVQLSCSIAQRPYSSCRFHQGPPASFRPLGARSSHCHIPHSPSSPRA